MSPKKKEKNNKYSTLNFNSYTDFESTNTLSKKKGKKKDK